MFLCSQASRMSMWWSLLDSASSWPSSSATASAEWASTSWSLPSACSGLSSCRAGSTRWTPTLARSPSEWRGERAGHTRHSRLCPSAWLVLIGALRFNDSEVRWFHSLPVRVLLLLFDACVNWGVEIQVCSLRKCHRATVQTGELLLNLINLIAGLTWSSNSLRGSLRMWAVQQFCTTSWHCSSLYLFVIRPEIKQNQEEIIGGNKILAATKLNIKLI